MNFSGRWFLLLLPPDQFLPSSLFLFLFNLIFLVLNINFFTVDRIPPPPPFLKKRDDELKLNTNLAALKVSLSVVCLVAYHRGRYIIY